MLSRRPIGMLLLTLALAAAGCDEPPPLAADAAARPAAAGSGPALAKVLLFRGEVSIEAANGHAFTARPEVPLIAGDAVVLGPASFVILQLGNGLLSRLDAADRYPVAELAGLDAPAAERSIQQQLTALLEPDEKRNTERIVGWHARMAAGEGVAVQSAEQEESRAMERREQAAAADFEADRVGAEPEHKARPPAPAAVESEKKLQPPGGEARAQPTMAKPSASGGQGLEAAAVEKPADALRVAPGSKLLAIRGAAGGEPIAIDEATRSYFAAWIRDVGDCRRLLAERSAETVSLIVAVEGRRVRRVTASAEPRLARCLTERWRGERAPAGVADGRYTLEVRWP